MDAGCVGDALDEWRVRERSEGCERGVWEMHGIDGRSERGVLGGWKE